MLTVFLWVMAVGVSEIRIMGYKRKFDRDLRYVKVMLMNQKKTMAPGEWIRFVHSTMRTIMNEPQNYLEDVPEKNILVPALYRVFKGFLEDQKIRDAQRRL